MKKILLLPFCLVLFLKASLGQIQFQKIYAPGTFENGPSANGYYVAQTADSGFIMTGKGSVTLNLNSGNVFLLKTNKLGTVQWYKEYGGSREDIGWWVEQTSDHGYIFSGQQKSSPITSGDKSYFGKTDSAGTLQWQRTYTGTGVNDITSVIKQTADGGYVTAGHTQLFASGARDACIIKLDATGTLQWMKTYGGTINEWIKDILQTPDGGYVATGFTNSFGAGDEDFLIMRTDASGNLLWFKTYGTGTTDIAYSICFAPDGGYVVAGGLSAPGQGVCLLKVDTSGNLQWCRTYGAGTAMSVKPSPAGGYVVTGGTQISNTTFTIALKTDTAGVREWYRFYNDGNSGNIIIQPTFDGGYVVGRGTFSYGAVYLVKTDASGNSGCNETSLSTTDSTFAPLVTTPTPVVGSPTPTLVTPPFTTTTPSVTDSTFCLLVQYFVDADHDGFGSTTTAMVPSSTPPVGYSTNNTDCNDNDASVHEPIEYFVDADHDGFGSTATAMVCSSTAPVGYSTNNTDCNDNDASIHPGSEVCGNNIDDNCNGQIDEGCCFISVSAGADVTLYFGYAPSQCVTKTVTVSNGTPPYTYNWTLDRPLLLDVVTPSGDETMTGANSQTVTVCLMDTAELCVIVTDAQNCTATDCATIFGEDVRCFTGNMGGDKVAMCHTNNNNSSTICVNQTAVNSHLVQGDYLGACNGQRLENRSDESSGFSIYPNPGNGMFELQMSNGNFTNVKIYDVLGNLIYRTASSANRMQINLSQKMSGIYFINVTDENNNLVTKKIVKM